MDKIVFPVDFEERMRSDLGASYHEFSEAHDQPAPVSIRINPGKPSLQGDAKPVPWTSTGVYLPERPSFTLDPTFHAGGYYVQEASSMFLEQALDQCVDPSGHLMFSTYALLREESQRIFEPSNKHSLLVSMKLSDSAQGCSRKISKNGVVITLWLPQ